jgi:hypothetical protein
MVCWFCEWCAGLSVVKMKPYTQDRVCVFLAIIPYIGFVACPFPFDVVIATNDLPLARVFSASLIDSICANGNGSLTIKSLTQAQTLDCITASGFRCVNTSLPRLCLSIAVNRRAILSRLGVETASKSFHLGMSLSSVLAGGIWSVLHGYDL